MTRAGRLGVVIVLVVVLGGVGGCAGGNLESRTRRLLGDRVEEVKEAVTPQATFNSVTSFSLRVTLSQGPVPEAAACDLLRRAATRVSKDETAGVSFRLKQSDTAADLVDYTWSEGSSRLIRWESPPWQGGGRLKMLRPVVYADGITSDDLKRFGSGSERPAWRAWPREGYPPTTK